jgi:hypothetical protein
MARYIENLNTCSDPTSGDYLWIVDASASSSDKDRKVDAGLFAQRGVANTFTATQTIASATGASSLGLTGTDNGTNWGGNISCGRNTNASTPAAGFLQMVDKGSQAYNVWPDDTGALRIHTALPTNANDTAGTVVGTQTSSLDSKDVLDGITSIEDVLAAVRAGAEAVRRFTYKSGAFNNEDFEGVVVDFAPRYGMDRDAGHPAGKSLNEIVIIGDLLRAVDNLAQRVAGLEAAR